MGNEERKDLEKSNRGNKKGRKILLIILLVILFFFVSVFGIVYAKYGDFLGNVFHIVKDVKKEKIKVEKPLNVLLLGMDIGDTNDMENEAIKRTDTIILANFDSISKNVKLVSIPRDTRVKINGKSQKINVAYPIGGEELVEELVEDILDIKVDYVMKIDYEGFRGIIDAIGGVDMYIEQNMNYDDSSQNLHIHFNKGETVHLNGEKAEEFFRWRKNNDGTGLPNGDIDRITNQQKLIDAVIEKLLSLSTLTKIDDIVNVLKNNVETDIPLEVLVSYGMEGIKVDSNNIEMITLPGEGKYVGNVSYFIEDKKATEELKSQLKSSDSKEGSPSKISRNDLSIKVLNCTKINGLAGIVEKELKEKGYSKVDIGNGVERATSQILIREESARGFMENDMNIKDIEEGIPSKYDKNNSYNVIIFLGKDYKDFGETK